MLKSPQAKGKRLEYTVRDILRQYGYTAQRNPMSGAIEWLKGDISSNFPFFIEVKNVENSKFLKWYKKAELESGAKKPIIIWSKNNEEIYCFVKFSDLLDTLSGKLIQPISKAKKPKKQSIEETASLPFSKYNQLHGKMPRI